MKTEEKEWYVKTFGRDYLKIYGHRNEQEAKQHVQFALAAMELQPGQKVLDLGCGYGRHAMELARHRFLVIGLDLSQELLKIAKQNACGQKLGIRFIRQDMRHIPFTGFFDAVFSFFTSFGYFDLDEENGKVIRAVSKALKINGQFFLDYLNVHYALDNMVSQDTKAMQDYSVVQKRSFDKHNFRIKKKILLNTTGTSREYTESVRAYGMAEIGSFFADAGLICTAVYGDYDGSTYSQQSKRLIMVGKKEL